MDVEIRSESAAVRDHPCVENERSVCLETVRVPPATSANVNVGVLNAKMTTFRHAIDRKRKSESFHRGVSPHLNTALMRNVCSFELGPQS
jgi:hypothetical protein